MDRGYKFYSEVRQAFSSDDFNIFIKFMAEFRLLNYKKYNSCQNVNKSVGELFSGFND